MTADRFVTYTVDRDRHIAHLTLRRLSARNAINTAMAAAMCEHLQEAERDDAVKVVVIDSSGPDLSAGWDLEEAWKIYVDQPGGATKKVPSQRARLTAPNELWWGPDGLYSRLLHCGKVTILAARGACLETGLYLTLCSDLVVAGADARFGNPRWSLLGVDGDISLLIATVGLKRAKALMYCAAEWDAGTALRHGLVDTVVPAESVNDEVNRVAAMCASIMRDGIVTEKFAVFASLEKMGIGFSFAAATVIGGSLSNIHFQPGEFNVLREVRDKGVESALTAAREWLRE